MEIYHYDPETGEAYAAGLADESPLEPGVFLVPANATTIAPPVVGVNEVAVFESGAWTTKPDFRGTKYWLSHDEEKTIDKIGETVPSGAFLEQPEPEPVPVTVVSMRQARLALLGAGYLSQVDAAIDGLAEPERTAAQIEWEYATTVERDSVLTQTLAAGLGLSEEQLDQLFEQAATL